jgi:hypothetical protein
MEVKRETYAKYKSTKGELETQLVKVGKVWLYFSFAELVAIRRGEDLVVCENVWSSTTGKHLNMLAPADKRLNKALFDELVGKVLGALDA